MYKMRFVKKTIAAIMVAALAITIVPADNVDAASVKLSKSKINVQVGSKTTLKIKGKGVKKATWKTNKKKVATVKKKGSLSAVVTAKGKGKAVISAVVKLAKSKKTLKCTVNVKKAEATKTPETTPVVMPTAIPVTPTATPSPTATQGPTEIPKLDENNLAVAEYPGIASDVPDLDIIRVGSNYYMVSTTMNLVPGVPVMKSTDLVNWEIVNYACNRFPDKELFNLENGQQTYGNGSWAASLKYNEDTGLFYVIYNVNSDGFYCYTTDDIENGKWKAYYSKSGYHDPALIFDDEDMYVIYSGNNIQKLYLEDAASEDEIGEVCAEGSSRPLFDKGLGGYNWSLWEGAHAYHIGDYYYLMIIGSHGGWFRREVCYRSKKLYDSTPEDWEAQMVFEGSTYEYGTGIAQGGIVDTIYGDWYGFLFQDHDGLGRVPSILAVNWDYTDDSGKNYKDWPMMGYYNDNNEFVSCQGTDQKITKPLTIRLNNSGKSNQFVGDDEFEYPDFADGDNLKLVWQWNHNPDDSNWSVTENPGYYRIKNGRTCNNIWFARNSLTQRTIGPKFTSETCILTNNMKPGDYAGLAAISADYAMVGVKCDDNGDRYVFQGCNSNGNSGKKATAADKIKENKVGEKIEADAPVYLKIEYAFNSGDIRADKATFYYSLDGSNWNKIGSDFGLRFDTGTTFMGTRSWLISYATKETGGYVDFDYYRCSRY